MVRSRSDSPRVPETSLSAETESPPAAPAQGVPRLARLRPWLPLAASLVLMPLLAYVTVAFLLVPQIHRALGAPARAAAPDLAGPSPETNTAAAKQKTRVPLNKMIVNVAGTMGTRYLMTSITLAGVHADFKNLVEEHRDEMLDLATGLLSNKSIADLEKPGARNQIRAELISIFNNALGQNLIEEIYFTELAIQ